MDERTPNGNETGALLKVLTAHYHALVSARSDAAVLQQYSELLRSLKAGAGRFPDRPVRAEAHGHRTIPRFDTESLRVASLDDLDRLVNDEATPRKDLEYIAIQRFSVPSGSMRSFSNKQMLLDKLRTLIRNERAHRTIGAVARGQARGTSDSGAED